MHQHVEYCRALRGRSSWGERQDRSPIERFGILRADCVDRAIGRANEECLGSKRSDPESRRYHCGRDGDRSTLCSAHRQPERFSHAGITPISSPLKLGLLPLSPPSVFRVAPAFCGGLFSCWVPRVSLPRKALAWLLSSRAAKLAPVADCQQARLYERLRRSPGASTVPGSLPVLFFGDLFSAEVASVGLNPSDREYLTNDGVLLAGPAQRFATTDSLGADNRSSLSDEQCAEAVRWMRNYFQPGKSVYSPWFNALTRVIDGFGASFHAGSSAHLDLVQESTKPVWSELDGLEREELLKQDLPFLEWEIRAFPLRAVIC